MNTTARRILVGTVAAGGLVAVAVLPTRADAASIGHFITLPEGTSRGLEISGVAVLNRTSHGTTGRVVLVGLEPGVSYAAHLHNQPCSAANPVAPTT